MAFESNRSFFFYSFLGVRMDFFYNFYFLHFFLGTKNNLFCLTTVLNTLQTVPFLLSLFDTIYFFFYLVILEETQSIIL